MLSDPEIGAIPAFAQTLSTLTDVPQLLVKLIGTSAIAELPTSIDRQVLSRKNRSGPPALRGSLSSPLSVLKRFPLELLLEAESRRRRDGETKRAQGESGETPS